MMDPQAIWQMRKDLATLASECRAWRELYAGYDALKPGEVDTTDERGALDRNTEKAKEPPCPPSARFVADESPATPTTTASRPSSTSTPDAGSGLTGGIRENLKHLRQIVENNIPSQAGTNEALVVLDLLEADIREAQRGRAFNVRNDNSHRGDGAESVAP